MQDKIKIWIAESIGYYVGVPPEKLNVKKIPPVIIGDGNKPVQGPGPYFPVWTANPVNNNSFTMMNPCK